MEKETAVNTPSPAAEKTDTQPVSETPAPVVEDVEERLNRLEAEKNRLIEEAANYKLGMLKAKGKIKEDPEEEDERMEQIARKVIADSHLAEITREQDAIIKKALKENRELKLAQLNRISTPPATVGTHTEVPLVKDTMVTSDQLTAFKARGWSDKDIERYKRNLQKHVR